MDSDFIKKHARHLTADELKDYTHLEGVPPLLQDCLTVVERDFEKQEKEWKESFAEQSEKEEEDLRNEFDNLEEKLYKIVRTASYEELEKRLEDVFTRFRLVMQI